MHFVYIIYSTSFNKYYKGYSKDPHKRLAEHNQGKSRYTKSFAPWELIFIERFENKSDALKREKVIKKYSKAQIQYLISSSRNQLN